MPRIGKVSRTWGFPIPLNPHNCAIVQRTWALLQLSSLKPECGDTISPSGESGNTININSEISYGANFKYSEFARAPGPISAFFISLGLNLALASLMFVPPVRWLLKRVGPKPGEGPSEEYAVVLFMQI